MWGTDVVESSKDHRKTKVVRLFSVPVGESDTKLESGRGNFGFLCFPFSFVFKDVICGEDRIFSRSSEHFNPSGLKEERKIGFVKQTNVTSRKV